MKKTHALNWISAARSVAPSLNLPALSVRPANLLLSAARPRIAAVAHRIQSFGQIAID